MDAVQAYEALTGQKGAKLSDYTEDDAAAVFVDAVMADPEQLEELWLDALSDLHAEDRKGDLLRLLRNLGGMNAEIAGVKDFSKISDGLCGSYSVCLTQKSAFAGQEVFSAIKKFVKTYVGRHAYEWLADAVSYEHEILEGNKVDWAYELGRERGMGL